MERRQISGAAYAPAQGGKVISNVKQSDIAFVYLPIVRTYLAATCLFYSILTPALLFCRNGPGLPFLAGGATAAALGAIGFLRCRRAPDFRALETWGLIANLAIIANIWIAIDLTFDPAKLVYFIVAAMIFASVGVSLRQILFSVAATLGVMACQIICKGHGHGFFLEFVGLGAAVASIGAWWLIRQALLQVIASRRSAREQQEKAERLEKQAWRQADADSMTGLPNRARLFHELDRRMNGLKQGGQAFLLAIVTLDGLNHTNDAIGNCPGAGIFKQVASNLQLAAGGENFCAHMGEDAFAVVSDVPETVADPESFGLRLRSALSGEYHFDPDKVKLSAWAGHYVCSNPNLTTTSVVERAEFALSIAKDRPAGAGDVFPPRVAEEMENWFDIERALRASDIDREFSVRFQPQIDLSSGETTGFEALARWNSPLLGETPPSLFIRIAETTGFISRLTPALLEKALDHAKAWPQAIPVSFNLSALDLVSTTTIDRVCEVVRRSGIAPGRIEFEITETALMHDFALARGNLRTLAECGHPIALDDFGVGYSNFSYLKQLPITKLKVDKSFLDGLGEDPAALKLVRAMIELAESLGMACVFEGVETQEEAQSLASVGGRVIQGYLVGEPMDPEAVAGFLQVFGQGDARDAKIPAPGNA